MKWYGHLLLKTLFCVAASVSCAPLEAMAQAAPVRTPPRQTVPQYVLEPPIRSTSVQRTIDAAKAASAVTLEDIKRLHYENRATKSTEQPAHRAGYIDPSDVKSLCELEKTVLNNEIGKRLLFGIQIQSIKRGVAREHSEDVAADVVKFILQKCEKINVSQDADIYLIVSDQIRNAVRIYVRVILKGKKLESLSEACELKDESEGADQILTITARDFDPEFVLNKLTPKQKMIATLLLNGFDKEQIIAELWPDSKEGTGENNYRQHVYQAVKRANQIICNEL